MTSLSELERAALRQEWSLECRQVGLNHLADCFKRPDAVNPADEHEHGRVVSSSSLSSLSSSCEEDDQNNKIRRRLNPIEVVTAGIAPTPDEPAKLAFLNGEGADAVAHTGNGKFDAHLLGVRRVLRAWGAGDDVCDAGLFHSIYGTEGFQGFCLPYERRDDVRALIGARAEQLVYIFCVVDRLSVDNDLDAAPGTHAFRARPELGGFDIPMDDDDMWFDFITLTLADWLEQVEGAAAGPNPLFEWDKGEAWGYRRRAYARMAEIVSEKIPEAKVLHAAVYDREPMKTRHLSQPITPPMSEEARIARVGKPQVKPKYV